MKKLEIERQLKSFEDQVNQEGRWLGVLFVAIDDDEEGLKEEDFSVVQQVLHLSPEGFEKGIVSLQENGILELQQTTEGDGTTHSVLKLTQKGKEFAAEGRAAISRSHAIRKQNKQN